MQGTLYETADAGDTMGQQMQETLYGTADAAVSLSDIRCRRHFMRQHMQETVYWTADVGDTL